jgi:hypothetical protein
MEIVNNKWTISELGPNLLLTKWRSMKLVHMYIMHMWMCTLYTFNIYNLHLSTIYIRILSYIFIKCW